MDLINLLWKLINENDINISYVNTNGKESLYVNGEKVEDTFDDSEIKEVIATYKQDIENLDDDVFVEAMDEIGDYLCLSEFDELLNKDSFTEEEADQILENINFMYNVISDNITDKIEYYKNMLINFSR